MGRPAAADEDTVWAAVDRERLELATLLESLSDEEWEQPSLCEGWRIRDVAAHLALAHTGPRQVLVDMARARGSFDRMVHDTARRHAGTPREHLIRAIRAMVGSRRHAPGVTRFEPLIDVLVHGQDIALPLGQSRPMPVDAATTAADRVWTMHWPLSTAFPSRKRFRGLELVAVDADWSAGEGARVEGPIEAILLLLTGRPVGLDRLTGPGLPQLTAAR
jgi:uncharacterized protein (TIGR03083 family)